jgi:hypothetical protein
MNQNAILYLFNLNVDAFAAFGFVDNISYLEKVHHKHPELSKVPRAQLIALIAASEKYVSPIFQDLSMLQNFNRRALLQSHSRAFCAKPHAYGINISNNE